MNRKIAIITFCLGSVPHWIDYFLRSCVFNKGIDWILFTDQSLKANQYENIKIINTSLAELNILVSEKTNVQVSIRHPYKLCEFRPAFGLIFNDYLQDYDYWGYCDIDLIFGDIFSFLERAFGTGYHIISPHKKFFHGHLCLLKNTPEINNIFSLSPDYKKIFRSNKLHVFDEKFYKEGINLDSDEIINNQILERIDNYIRYKRRIRILSKIKFWNSTGIKQRAKRSIYLNDFNQIVNYLEKEGKIQTYRETLYECDIMKAVQDKDHWKITWKNGKLFNEQSKEILYFHFQLSKYMNRFTINDNINEDNSFVFESAVN